MAKKEKSKKRETAAPKKKKKSKLPDLVSGKFCIAAVNPDNRVSGILQDDGTAFPLLPALPYIFPSKTHAAAYIDGMAPHIKPAGMKIVPQKLADFYGQHFKIVDGEPGQAERILTTLVKKEEAVSFKQAVADRYAEAYASKFQGLQTEVKSELESHKREIKERERAHKERLKAKRSELAAAEKAVKSFMAQMKKLGG